MKFEDAVEVILKAEGGYVKDPRDPGGETNFGISKRTYPMLDIKELKVEQAKEIYKRDFWDRYKIESLPQVLRLAVFDSCINQGPNYAIGTLQAVLGITIDGVIGTQTIEAALNCNHLKALEKFAMRRFLGYQENKNFARYGVGWLKRLLEVSLRSTQVAKGDS